MLCALKRAIKYFVCWAVVMNERWWTTRRNRLWCLFVFHLKAQISDLGTERKYAVQRSSQYFVHPRRSGGRCYITRCPLLTFLCSIKWSLVYFCKQWRGLRKPCVLWKWALSPPGHTLSSTISLSSRQCSLKLLHIWWRTLTGSLNFLS